jgi:hypothetical protein
MILRLAPARFQHRARVRDRLDLIQGLRRLDSAREDAP